MRKIVPILAGPYEDKYEAFWQRMKSGQWVSFQQVRKLYHGWYILDRSKATTHPGSKKFRKRAKERKENA